MKFVNTSYSSLENKPAEATSSVFANTTYRLMINPSSGHRKQINLYKLKHTIERKPTTTQTEM